jgi:DnaJ family protein C protein 13
MKNEKLTVLLKVVALMLFNNFSSYILFFIYSVPSSTIFHSFFNSLQQAANNLAKSSVIACVALSGYNVVFKAEEKEIEEPTESSETSSSSTTPTITTTERPKEIQGKTEYVQQASNLYTSNASNILQNNQSLIVAGKNENPPSPGEDVATSENENGKTVSKSFSKYTVSGTAKNIVVKSILDILLTPFISNKLADDAEHEVLKILTQNTRNPYLIWDNGTRTQLLDFLEHQRQNSSKEQYADITDIYNTISKFIYDATRDELKIGGVYIRIYNEMPTFPIQNPKMFVLDLLEYLKQAHMYLNGKKIINNRQQSFNQTSPQKLPGQLPKPLIPTPVKNNQQPNQNNQKNIDNILNDYNRSKIKHQLEKNENGTSKINYDFASDQKFVEHLIMTLNSLISVIKLNPNVELQCIGNFDILFGLLNTNIKEQVC